MRIAMAEPWVYMSLALHVLWNVHGTDDFKLAGLLSVVATGISALLQLLVLPQRVGAHNVNVDDHTHEHGWVMGSSLVPLLMTSLWMAMIPTSTTLASSSHMRIPLIYTVLTCSVGLALSLSFLCHVMFTTRKKARFGTPTKWNILGMQSLIVPLAIYYHNTMYQQQDQRHDSPIMESSMNQMNSIVSIVYIGMQTIFWSILYTGHSGAPEKADSKEKQTQLGRPMVTLGECAVLSNVGSIVVTDYVIRYIVGYVYGESPSSSSSSTRPYYWVASQAGLLGCLGGCTLTTVIWNRSTTRNRRSLWKRHSLWIAGLVASTTYVSLEWAFYCEDKFYYVQTMTAGDATTIDSRNRSGQQVWWHSSFLSWLISFLCETEGSIPRYWWLLYWMIVLVVTMGLAVAWLIRRGHDTVSSSHLNLSVVVTRKWFHGVAVALFWPVTYAAPHLMSLSYAIATALLLLMECLRLLPSHSLHDTPMRTIATTTTHHHHHHHPQPVRGTRVTLNDTLNDFYAAFLDDTKDGGGGGPVWSHLALIVGCAAPLWIDEWLLWSSMSTTTIVRLLLPHVGILVLGVGDAAGAVVGVYWGRHRWPQSRRTMEGSLAMFVTMYLFVVVVGDGDIISMTKRMMSTNIIIFATLLRLTLLEASTSQIDNLCLPLVGVTSLLLHQP
eukprot:scaffold11962_cov59-Attheya_sp.AAC.5